MFARAADSAEESARSLEMSFAADSPYGIVAQMSRHVDRAG
jgi:hypothetical protein